MNTVAIKRWARGAQPGSPLSMGSRAWVDARVQAAKERLAQAWNWLQARQKARLAARSLQVEENVSLGQKRFVAVVKVGDQRFLLGGGGNDVSLLACLTPAQTFQEALRDSNHGAKTVAAKPRKRPARAQASEAEKCA